MEVKLPFPYENLFKNCRVCMKEDGFRNIYEDIGHGMSASEKIAYCTGLMFSNEDGLPTHLCKSCVNDLDVAYKFKFTCLQSNEEFRKIKINLDIKIKDENSILSALGPEFSDASHSQFFNVQKSESNGLANMLKSDLEDFVPSTRRSSLDRDDAFEDNFLYFDIKTSNTNDLDAVQAVDVERNDTTEVGTTRACEQCNAKFANETELNLHTKNEHSENTRETVKSKHSCKECKLHFNTRQAAYAHRRKKHGAAVKKAKRTAKKETVIGDEDKKYECVECDLNFPNRHRLYDHRQKHKQNKINHRVKQFKCDVCSMEFSDNYKYAYHMHETHNVPLSDNGIHKCKTCSLECASKYKLLKHRKEVHGFKQPKSLHCYDCNIDFKDRFESSAHRNKFHRKKHICEICGIVCGARHKQYHSMPNFWCEHCEYKSTNKSDLRKHIRTHFEYTKTYACDQCPYRARFSSNLNEHIRRCHDKLKRFACHICEYRCADKRVLQQHIDAHNCIKRYHCDVCGTRMAKLYSFKKHLLKQHGIASEPLKPGRKRQYLVTDQSAQAQDSSSVHMALAAHGAMVLKGRKHLSL